MLSVERHENHLSNSNTSCDSQNIQFQSKKGGIKLVLFWRLDLPAHFQPLKSTELEIT
jgi:hypothetical protein